MGHDHSLEDSFHSIILIPRSLIVTPKMAAGTCIRRDNPVTVAVLRTAIKETHFII
jgi:hypothetical protein